MSDKVIATIIIVTIVLTIILGMLSVFRDWGISKLENDTFMDSIGDGYSIPDPDIIHIQIGAENAYL